MKFTKNNKLYMSLLIVFSFSYTQAVDESGEQNIVDANQCNRKIIHLPQTHAVSVGVDELTVADEDLETTAKSQFKIFRFIEDNSGIPVFSEQVSENILCGAESLSAACSYRSAFMEGFDEGLPQYYSELSRSQKMVIAKTGGDAVALFSSSIHSLLKTAPSNELYDQFIDEGEELLEGDGEVRVGTPLFVKFFDEREQMALVEIKKYFDTNPERDTVILVLGRNHALARHSAFDEFSNFCVSVPASFKSDHIGSGFEWVPPVRTKWMD